MSANKREPGSQPAGKKPKVREGQEDSSILDDGKPLPDAPHPDLPGKHKQLESHPEFIDTEANLTSKDKA